MGRRTILTTVITEAVCDALRAHNTFADAAEYAQIGESTHWSWMTRGERELARIEGTNRKVRASEAPYVDYVESVKKARADAKVRAVSQVANAMTDHWQAAAWWLERTDPRNWAAPRIRLELGFDQEKPLEVTIDRRDALAEELAGLADRIAPRPIDTTATETPSPLEEVFDLAPARPPT